MKTIKSLNASSLVIWAGGESRFSIVEVFRSPTNYFCVLLLWLVSIMQYCLYEINIYGPISLSKLLHRSLVRLCSTVCSLYHVTVFVYVHDCETLRNDFNSHKLNVQKLHSIFTRRNTSRSQKYYLQKSTSKRSAWELSTNLVNAWVYSEKRFSRCFFFSDIFPLKFHSRVKMFF